MSLLSFPDKFVRETKYLVLHPYLCCLFKMNQRKEQTKKHNLKGPKSVKHRQMNITQSSN